MAPIGVLMPTYTQWWPILQNDTTYCQSRNYENRVEIVASYLGLGGAGKNSLFQNEIGQWGQHFYSYFDDLVIGRGE